VAPLFHIDEEWLVTRREEILEPSLPIVDPHHHFWVRSTPYLADHLGADLRFGHNIRATVYVGAWFALRKSADASFATIGEVVYANGMGALFASGHYSDTHACAGIVGKVDLTLGDFAAEVITACLARAPERFRGVRHMAAWDASPHVSQPMRRPPPGLTADRRFREGFSKLGSFGLSFDAWCYHPQLMELAALVDSAPITRVIIDHVGGRLGEGPYAGAERGVFQHWRASMQELARRPNVPVKIGGMMAHYIGTTIMDHEHPPSSLEPAALWRPYVETCIELFGPRRCMFESNFPPDKAGCSYAVLWNVFKRLAVHYSDDERWWLFSGTAMHAYRLPPEYSNEIRTVVNLKQNAPQSPTPTSGSVVRQDHIRRLLPDHHARNTGVS
jgi:L-fuconolactonase